jgi:hypothetical protein
VKETRASVFDAAACAAIAADYQLDGQGELDEDEAMRCRACGFTSRLPGTPVSAWRRRSLETEPPVVELCEIYNAAAVSRQVSLLQGWLGQTLFVEEGRRMALGSVRCRCWRSTSPAEG